jgi:hypothetical protein
MASIRRGNFWPDDYALYVHHAENIAEGRPYADTGYIYNPGAADYSPRAYPPVFPLLPAPICRAYGLDLHAMKIEVVVFFVLALATNISSGLRLKDILLYVWRRWGVGFGEGNSPSLCAEHVTLRQDDFRERPRRSGIRSSQSDPVLATSTDISDAR